MIKILGHRGFSFNYPENTLLSFQKAFDAGADGIECDIQKCKDGKYIVFHDLSIDRFANSKAKVNELSLKDIKNIDLCNNEKILELEEFLKWFPKDKFLNIELKKETISESDNGKIFELLEKYLKKENILISSFNYKLLYFYKKKKINIGLLIGKEVKNLGIFGSLMLLMKLGPEYINIPSEIFDEFGDVLAKMILVILRLFRKKIVFWVVNSKECFDKVLKYSDVIITDDPRFINQCLNRR